MFKSRVTLTHIPNQFHWVVFEPITYYTEKYGETITVPKGFITDLASVPRVIWWLIPNDGRHIIEGSVVHDWLYANAGEIPGWKYSRTQANFVLREAMREQGASRWERFVVWAALQAFGFISWNRHKKAKVALENDTIATTTQQTKTDAV